MVGTIDVTIFVYNVNQNMFVYTIARKLNKTAIVRMK